MIYSGKDKKIKRLDSNQINDIYSEYEDILSATKPVYEIGKKNFNLYAPGSSYDMYDDPTKAAFVSQNRTPKIYNFIPMQVEGICANLMVNLADPKFVANNDLVKDSVIALQKKYYNDKDRYRYNLSLLSSVTNGLIFRGIEGIGLKYDENNPMGRIAFENINPLMFHSDPDVNDDDFITPSKRAFKTFFFTPKQIIAMYPHLERDVKRAIMMKQYPTEQYEGKLNTDAPIDLNLWGSKLRVVEYYHIEKVTTRLDYDMLNGIYLPKTEFNYGTQEDVMAKIDWANSKGYDINAEMIRPMVRDKEELWLTTIIPDLQIVLENNKDRRQLSNGNGGVRLPFFGWAFVMKNGITNSVIDTVKDAQDDINKREAQKTKLFMKSQIGTKTIMHEMMAEDDPVKREQMIREWGDTSIPHIVSKKVPIGLFKDLVAKKQGDMINPSLFQEESFKIDMMNKIGRFNEAMQGLSGGSNESGKLYRSKVYEGSMLLKVPATRLDEYNKQKYSAYAELAIKVYGGETEAEKFANLDTEFNYKDEKIILNEVVGVKPQSEEKMMSNQIGYSDLVINNDLSKLTRDDITIESGQNNESYKQLRRFEIEDSLAKLPYDPVNGPIRAALMKELFELNDTLDSDDRKTMEDAVNLAMRVTTKRLMSEEAQLDNLMQQNMMAQSGLTNAEGGTTMPGVSPMPKTERTDNVQSRRA